jgi:hypothetical protein
MGAITTEGIVAGVFVSGAHTFSKSERHSVTLLQGLGIESDAHCGSTVQHLSDRKNDPTRPNLRQLHLIQNELIEELNATGFDVRPGDLGDISPRGRLICRPCLRARCCGSLRGWNRGLALLVFDNAATSR